MGVTGSGGINSFRGFAYIIMEEKQSADALVQLEKLKFKKSTIIIKKCRDQEKSANSEDKTLQAGKKGPSG